MKRGLGTAGAVAAVAVFVLAEVLAVTVDARIGVAVHAGLVVVLANVYVLRATARSRGLVAALALASLSRLLVVAIPLAGLPWATYVAVVGALLLVTILLTLRLPHVDWRKLGLRPQSWKRQGLIGLSGAPLSLASFGLLHPHPVLRGGSVAAFVAAALSLTVFSALPEELLFRGLLVPAARESLGRAGPVAAAAVFTGAYVGTRAVPFLALAALTGLYFGWCYERTGSLAGVVAAHCLLNIGTFLILPSLI
jgi:uncharacterized protein